MKPRRITLLRSGGLPGALVSHHVVLKHLFLSLLGAIFKLCKFLTIILTAFSAGGSLPRSWTLWHLPWVPFRFTRPLAQQSPNRIPLPLCCHLLSPPLR